MDDNIPTRAELLSELASLRARLAEWERLDGERRADVAARRQAEESLRDSEAFLRMSQHAGHVGSWEWSLLDNRVRWSDEMYCIHGISPDQFDGTLEGAVQLIHPDDRAGVAEGIRYILEQGALIPGEHRIVRPDGTQRVLWGMGEVLRDATDQPVRLIGTVMDVTERRQAEMELRERNAVLQYAIEGIGELDGRGRFTFVNGAYAAMAGYVPGEMVGMGWDSTIHAEDREKLRAAYQHLQTQGKAEVTVRGVRKDGSIFHKEVVLVRKPSGAEIEGGHYRFVKDISDRARLEENLRRAQKLEALGQLASGVAHDFNNLLTGIFGNASLLLDGLPPGTPGREQAQDIERAAARAAELTQQLLGFARQAVLRLVPTDVRTCVDEAVRLLRRTIDPRITIEVRAQPDLWRVRVDAGQINQVIMNLGLNARDAMPEGGSLILETANIAVGSDQVQRGPEARVGEFVRLRVTDTGSGMAPEVRERIFEPFFTTKEPGKGTGLGLAMVFGIIRQHQGWIECHSEVGRGSQFEFYLPRCHDLPAVAAGLEAGPVAGGSETILLVDDEAVVRNLGHTILTRRGYRVLVAEDGQQAVEIYQGCPGRIDLVILDLTMPRLSGRDTLQRIRAIDPGVPVLLASGYAAEQLADPGAEGVVAFLHKPYRPQELASVVRVALDRKRTRGELT